ncbi:MAG: glutathione synthase [Burkholderiales bacterium]|jgi:glutathione synthase|nr:glutathione synthase [Burkholderiales bacterium]
MKTLFILDPLPKLKAYKDSSIAMMRALVKRDHHVYACGIGDLSVSHDGGRVLFSELTLYQDNVHWYASTPVEEAPFTAFDAIVMRKDPPFDTEYLYATYLLETAERMGVAVFNKPQSIRDFNEKMSILRFPECIAPTLVTRNPQWLHEFIDEHRDVILKPLDGMGGASVFRVRVDDPNRNVIIETLNAFGARSVMAQRFIPEIRNGDKRVLLIDGEVVPYALARIPKNGETRGNLAAGGRGVAMPLTEWEKHVAETLSPRLRSLGLFVVGLDMIGGLLTEINVTSPTCFVEIADQTGYYVADLFVQKLESAVS